MSTPAAKRQRVEAASRKLCQPFRSPLKRPDCGTKQVTASPNIQAKDNVTLSAFTSCPRGTIDSKAGSGVLIDATDEGGDAEECGPMRANSPWERSLKRDDTCYNLASPSQPRQKTMPSTPLRASGQRPFVTPLPNSRVSERHGQTYSALSKYPALAALLRSQRELESEIRDARMELDTLEQARKIQNGSRDQELERLIIKWRNVSRQAAEEVFGGAQARINRMGGLTAWRDMQKRQDEWRDGAFTDDAPEELNDSQRDALCAEYDIDPKDMAKPRGEVVNGSQGDGQEHSEEYTMEMMLSSLNIELSTIGYDKHLQRWVD